MEAPSWMDHFQGSFLFRCTHTGLARTTLAHIGATAPSNDAVGAVMDFAR